MKTNLADFIKNTPDGQEANAILRTCVHCGFCNATCPTYQILGDELDGPRGRIYLMKEMLEGRQTSPKTQLHLDRCLTCHACETTCPSGVKYGRLVDIGRKIVDQQVNRSVWQRAQRAMLRRVIPDRRLFTPLLRLGQRARPLLPSAIALKVPRSRPAGPWPPARHERRMLVLQGCVQPAIAPDTNAALARVLDRIGISLFEAATAGCCGAVAYHLDDQEGGLDYMRRNIDAWWPDVEQGVEAIVMTASGCGAVVREYGLLLARDPRYATKARRVSELTKDAAEIVSAERSALVSCLPPPASSLPSVAFHSPCTLQHWQQIRGVVESLLAAAGYGLTAVPDSHLCCGSAGTYSILQPELSQQLLHNKVNALQSGHPEVIATANIGCQTHIQSGTPLPVRHWIELLDAVLT